MKKTLRFIIILVTALVFTSCVTTKNVYERPKNMAEYHKKVKKQYERNQKKHGVFFVDNAKKQK